MHTQCLTMTNCLMCGLLYSTLDLPKGYWYMGYWYMGFRLGHVQVCSQMNKTAASVACPRTKTKKKVRQFLELAGYYYSFVPNYSDVTSLLTDLTKKEAPDLIQWSHANRHLLR